MFIGVSAPGVVDRDMLRAWPVNRSFCHGQPDPEIMRRRKETGVKVMGTWRSDYPNQMNTVLAFPGIFRGALDVRAADINDEMKIAASRAIAFLVDGNELDAKYILPEPFDDRVGSRVAAAVAGAARESGVARL